MNMETIREWLNGKTRIAVSYPEKDRFVHLSLIHVVLEPVNG